MTNATSLNGTVAGKTTAEDHGNVIYHQWVEETTIQDTDEILLLNFNDNDVLRSVWTWQ